jgi:hypothetical protein
MALVVTSLLNKQVGGELSISEITVKAHRRHVMRKMKANSLTDLVRMAVKLGPGRKAIHLGAKAFATESFKDSGLSSYARAEAKCWHTLGTQT